MKPSSVAPWVILIIVVIGLSAYVATQHPSTIGQVAHTAQTTNGLQGARVVSFMISYIPQGIFAPFYAGVDQGLWAKYGLDVNVIPSPQGAAGSLRALSGGKVDFALSDVGTIVSLKAKENITNVKIIALEYSGNPNAVVFLQGNGRPEISAPKDLENKSICAGSGQVSTLMFPFFAKANGIELSKVNIIYQSVSLIYPGLLSGKCDALLGFVVGKAALDDSASKKGLRVGMFPYANYGFDVYTNMLVTRTDIITNNPDLVRRFLMGYEDAIRFSAVHPQQAIESLIKLNPQLDHTISYGQWRIILPYFGGNSTVLEAKNPLSISWIDPAKMETSVKIQSQMLGIPAPNPDSIYTNDFVVKPGT